MRTDSHNCQTTTINSNQSQWYGWKCNKRQTHNTSNNVTITNEAYNSLFYYQGRTSINVMTACINQFPFHLSCRGSPFLTTIHSIIHTLHSQRDSRLGLERPGVVLGHPRGSAFVSGDESHCCITPLHPFFHSLYQSFIFHLWFNSNP